MRNSRDVFSGARSAMTPCYSPLRYSVGTLLFLLWLPLTLRGTTGGQSIVSPGTVSGYFLEYTQSDTCGNKFSGGWPEPVTLPLLASPRNLAHIGPIVKNSDGTYMPQEVTFSDHLVVTEPDTNIDAL